LVANIIFFLYLCGMKQILLSIAALLMVLSATAQSPKADDVLASLRK
jgi:hypothetical protein